MVIIPAEYKHSLIKNMQSVANEPELEENAEQSNDITTPQNEAGILTVQKHASKKVTNRNILIMATCIANLVPFCTGIMLAWSSPMLIKLESLEEDNPLSAPITSDDKSWIAALLSIGAAVGPFPYAFLQNKIGRKYTLLMLTVPYIAVYLLAAFATNVAAFFAVRAIAGLAVGGTFTIVPTYLAEISDSEVRGMMGTSLNNLLCTGLIFSYIFGVYLPIMWYNILAALLSVICLVSIILFLPESPYYLMLKSKERAGQVLAYIRGRSVCKIQEELKEIEQNIVDSRTNTGNFFDVFKSKGTVKAFIISVMLIIFQQLSGINVVLFYAQEIFNAAGSTMDAAISPIIISCVQFASSFIAPLVVDRLGRRTLLMISTMGMVISQVPLGVYFYLKDEEADVSNISYLPVIALILYIIFFNCGIGPVSWAVLAEVLPDNIKSVGASFVGSTCWTVSFLLTYFFDSIQNQVGIGGSFWIFSGCTAIGFIFTAFYVPETKGKTLQEIQHILNS